MKPEEAFRVAVVSDMRTASLLSISRAWDRARPLVSKVLSPLHLGERLQLGFTEDAHSRGWLVVRIAPNGQQPLFAELDAIESHEGGVEAASARLLLREWLTRLKKMMQQFSLSGYELETMASDMPDLKSLQTAFGVRVKDQTRALIHSERSTLDDFELSPLPGRHLGKPVKIVFWIEMLGTRCAHVRLPRPARHVVGADRGTCLLRWDKHSVDQSIWDHLLFCMRGQKPVQSEVTPVYRASGKLVELLVVKVLPTRAPAFQEPVEAIANAQILDEMTQ